MTDFSTYTPGHSQNATDFMSLRTLKTHGQFFLSHLQPGLSVLDCGCGPGSITLDIAERVAPSKVVAIDIEDSQIALGVEGAENRNCDNVCFQSGDVYSLPFGDNSFDRIFSHALMEHLAEPVKAMRELLRVLKPDGVIGVCSPDWGGFILSPPSDLLSAATKAYTTLQSLNGGDVNVGRSLSFYLASAGFEQCQMSARYEVYSDREIIGDYLALRLEAAGDTTSAKTLRSWSRQSGGLFAQCWVSCIARKPESARNK